MFRPSTSRGLPAFGCADNRTRVTASIRSIVSSIGAGPTAQLTPMTVAPCFSSSGAKRSGGVPSSVLPSSSVVICATIGRSDSDRTASIAAPISFKSRKVSSTNRSTPPSIRARICSRKALARLVDAGLAPRLDPDAEGPDRSGHVGALARRAPRDARTLHVDRPRATRPGRTTRA